jgi:exonuclease III
VALQEYRPNVKGAQLQQLLYAAGLQFAHSAANTGFCNAIFSRTAITVAPLPAGLPTDRWANYWIEAECDGLGLSIVHIPIPRYRDMRRAYWEAVLRRAEEMAQHNHLIIGDFNTTRHGIDEIGKSVPGDAWLRELEARGWVEGWRQCNPDKHEFTWFSRQNNGFRVDQAWLSPITLPRMRTSQIDPAGRLQGLSDHSMLLLDLDTQK